MVKRFSISSGILLEIIQSTKHKFDDHTKWIGTINVMILGRNCIFFLYAINSRESPYASEPDFESTCPNAHSGFHPLKSWFSVFFSSVCFFLCVDGIIASYFFVVVVFPPFKCGSFLVDSVDWWVENELMDSDRYDE